MQFVKLIVKPLMEGLVMMEGLVTLYKMQNDMTCSSIGQGRTLYLLKKKSCASAQKAL